MKRYLLAAAAALLVSVPAAAQRQTVVTQLDSAVVLMNNAGFRQAGQPLMGTLRQNGGEQFRIEVESGRQYIIMGVCDGSCSDLDLVVADERGTEVGADRETDDVPMVALEGGRSYSGVVSLVMAACTGDCHYGVAVFTPRK